MENSYFNELALLTHASTEVIIALANPSCWSTFSASIVSIHKAMDVPSIIIGEQNLKKQHHFAPPQILYPLIACRYLLFSSGRHVRMDYTH